MTFILIFILGTHISVIGEFPSADSCHRAATDLVAMNSWRMTREGYTQDGWQVSCLAKTMDGKTKEGAGSFPLYRK